MKSIYIAFLSLISIYTINAQSINTEVTQNGRTLLLGKIDKAGLQGDKYSAWFTKSYEDYKPNSATIKNLSKTLDNYTLKLFMGTWCGDSKREVPRMYKVLEMANFPMHQLEVIAVNNASHMYKQSPQHEEAGLNIHRVPILIVYKKGKEINRIVEHPVTSIEEDLLNIISTNDYKSNYYVVTEVDNILKKKGLKGLKKKSKKIIDSYKDEVSSMYELNTYGKILFNLDKKDEAIEVYRLNTKLFPKKPRTYMSLANTLGVNHQKEEAIKVLNDAIVLFPNNNDLKRNLDVISSH